jgi:hypothetical protein
MFNIPIGEKVFNIKNVQSFCIYFANYREKCIGADSGQANKIGESAFRAA